MVQRGCYDDGVLNAGAAAMLFVAGREGLTFEIVTFAKMLQDWMRLELESKVLEGNEKE